MIKRKLLDKGCCENDRWNKFKDLWSRAWMCVNKINGITPDGDNNFTIVGGDSITVIPEGNGLRISSDGGSDVKSLNGKKGNVVLETNDSAIEVTSNDDHTIGVQLADWVFDEMGQFTTDINDLKDQVIDLDDYTDTLNTRINAIGLKVGSINNITPDGVGDLKVVGNDGIVVNSGVDNKLYIGIQGSKLTDINKIPTIESNVTSLQNELKVKKINNIDPTSAGNFTISAGNNITLTPTTNGIEIASSDWTRWTGGNNWVNENLFNSSRIALKDILICFNAGVSDVSNLFLKGQLYISKGGALDLMGSMVLDTYGSWCNDKIVHSSYLSTDTTDIYSSLSSNTMKVYLKYRQIHSNNAIGNITSTTVQLNKSNGTTLYYK